MLENVFIVKKDSNELIFYGQLSDSPIENLETVLGQIIMKAASQSVGAKKSLALKQGKFLYGVFENFYIILHLKKGISKSKGMSLLKKLGKDFKKKYSRQLLQYAGDNSIFSGFSKSIQEAISKKEEKTKEKEKPSIKPIKTPRPTKKPKISKKMEEEEKTKKVKAENLDEGDVVEDEDGSIPLSQRRGMIKLKKSKSTSATSDDLSADKPIIKPSTDREAYPDGIPDYARDEILFNESFDVQKNFECELVDYNVSVIDVRLNISPQHIYTIRIDFTNYPETPKITISDGLKKELGKPMEEISYFLKNWDPKIPPHITEIVYELEKLLIRFKSEGKLGATQEMPDYVLPELEPLKGDIKYDPNVAQTGEVEPPKYDGSELTDKYKSERQEQEEKAATKPPKPKPVQSKNPTKAGPKNPKTQMGKKKKNKDKDKKRKKWKFGRKKKKK